MLKKKLKLKKKQIIPKVIGKVIGLVGGVEFDTEGRFAYIPYDMYKDSTADTWFPLMLVSKLKLWGKNPRKNDPAVPKLVVLLKIHGFRKPIVVDQNNIVRAGNTALKAARVLGMTMIPAAKTHFRSEVSATAYGISDNRASENSTWDDDMLADLMKTDDLSYGFSEDELNLRLKSEMQINEKELDLLNTDNECPQCGYRW